ncbi:hypothetical protein IV203_027976 [Nitzschia inconspicua]|uniref:Uncharacterized protein n=1 Tax=Nitzschia inconspicua TaxID=303405 RepID=A0A9K3LYQ5_9STRA|nr:hypothetical protein IV203_027976 [Nitzschia inconspicua]
MCPCSHRKSGKASSAALSSSGKKRVRFCTENLEQIHEIPHVSQFSQRHLTQCFYTAHEFACIAAENNTILKYMMIGGEGLRHVETSTSTTRGLEFKTLEGAEQKKIATLDGLCAVLLEQERQKQKHVVDEERIRQAYLAYTQVPAMAAVNQARRDARIHEEGIPQQHQQKTLAGKNLIKSLHFKKNFNINDDIQSTATTLISSETASDSFAGGGDGTRKKSIVRRLLKGSRLFPTSKSKKQLSVTGSNTSETIFSSYQYYG